MRKLLATIAIVTLATIGAAGTVGAGQEQVCPDLDTGHLSANDQTSFTFTAPPGQLIVQICVKAGSIQQGNGPEFIDYNPPVSEATFEHSSGKEISHFSVKFGEAPPPPNGTTPTTTPGQQVTPPPGAPARIVVGAAPFTG